MYSVEVQENDEQVGDVVIIPERKRGDVGLEIELARCPEDTGCVRHTVAVAAAATGSLAVDPCSVSRGEESTADWPSLNVRGMLLPTLSEELTEYQIEIDCRQVGV